MTISSVSRRKFLAATAGLAGMTLAGNRMLGQALEPKRGGTFRAAFAEGSTTDTLDPALWANNFTSQFGRGLFAEALLEVTPTNTVTPNLAESFETSDRGKTWIFNLRRGVTFHNGREMEARDVLASFRHHMGEDSKSAAKSLVSDIAEILLDTKHRVIFKLNTINADFPAQVADFHLSIFPAKDDSATGIEWEAGNGTGPYVLKSFEPGIRLTGKRNRDYHGTTWFDEVELNTVADVAARMNALVTGQVDYANRCDLKTLSKIEQVSGLAIDEVAGIGYIQWPMNVTVAPFDNRDVRLAIKHAIDREEFLAKIFHGHGTLANDNPISPSLQFGAQTDPVHSYDPDKAKFHLKKSGQQTIEVDLSFAEAAFAGAEDAAVLAQQQAKACGITINLRREPTDGYWSNVWMRKPWCMSSFGGRPTADAQLRLAYVSGAKWNDTSWSNAQFDGIVDAARAEIDTAKRTEMYAEVQQLIHDDGGAFIPMFMNYVSARSTKLAHGEMNTDQPNDGGYLCKRWWFA